MLMPPYDDEAPLPKRFEVSLPRNREFLGHDSLFSVIQRKLRSVPMFILTGVGGIGKTQFALEYAYRHRDDYHFVWWIDGQSAQTMRRAHLDIANALGVPRSKSEEERIELVFTRLNANSNWLLVYDDVSDPPDFFQRFPMYPDGSVIVTSRTRWWGTHGMKYQMGYWSEATSLEFLKHMTRNSDIVFGKKLVRQFGYLPLAIKQAAAYINENQISYEECLIRFNKGTNLFETPPRDYPRTVHNVWERELRQLREDADYDPFILNTFAFLSDAPIPRFLLPGLATIFAGNPLEPAQLADKMEKWLEWFATSTLFTLTKENINVCAIFQWVIRKNLEEKEEAAPWKKYALRLVVENTPRFETPPIQTMNSLLPHAEAVLRFNSAKYHNTAQNFLASTFGIFAHHVQEYGRAKGLLEQALKGYENNHGIFHPHTILARNNLAFNFWRDEKLHLAEEFYTFNLDHYSRANDANEDSIHTLNLLFEMYDGSGKYKKAIPYAERKYEALKEFLAPDHPATLLAGIQWCKCIAFTASQLNDTMELNRADDVLMKIENDLLPLIQSGDLTIYEHLGLFKDIYEQLDIADEFSAIYFAAMEGLERSVVPGGVVRLAPFTRFFYNLFNWRRKLKIKREIREREKMRHTESKHWRNIRKQRHRERNRQRSTFNVFSRSYTDEFVDEMDRRNKRRGL